ncbi:Uncharacterized protein FKW44_020619 [Caligus rogercresseyi]|uniref:Uncharacterized protein n=1 Tax=Caligus rogercresseyi TaxID=217165 RepID=A0A7T8GXS9_CALRO|nr:Uncharacterized protein FKW44_020619 [Caligus rogercresseyi]
MAGSVLEYEEKNSSSGETPLMDKLMEAVKSSSSDSNVESHIASMMGKLPD